MKSNIEPAKRTASEEEVIRARAREKRKHKVVTRRERLRKHLRAWRLAFAAIGLALAVVLLMNWRDIYTYLRFYFMD